MTGVEPLLAKLAGTVAGKLVAAATQPVLDGIRHALVRKGYARGGLIEALQLVEQRLDLGPSGKVRSLELPPGMTETHITQMSSLPEMVTLTRLLVSTFLVNAADHVEYEIQRAIPQESESRFKQTAYDRLVSVAPRAAGRQLREYADGFYAILRQHCWETANALTRYRE